MVAAAPFIAGAGLIIIATASTANAPAPAPTSEPEQDRRGPGGFATIHWYPPGTFNNPDHTTAYPHYSVTVMANGQMLTTELTTVANMAMIQQDPMTPSPTNSVTIPLPDATAAMEFQRSVLGQSVGGFDPQTNSCVTHVGDVLRAGGVPAGTPGSVMSVLKFFRSIGVPLR
jgi:hypothetical protein